MTKHAKHHKTGFSSDEGTSVTEPFLLWSRTLRSPNRLTKLSYPKKYNSVVDRRKQKESNRRPNPNLQIKCSTRTDWARNKFGSPRCKILCIQIAAIVEQQWNRTYRTCTDLHQRASVTPPPFYSSGARFSA